LSCTSRLASARWINIYMFYATPSVSSLADWQGICNPIQHQLNPPKCVAKIEEWSISGPDSPGQLILAEHLVAAIFLERS
jgi:hypothetical protein